MIRTIIFIKSWFYYPKLIKYLRKTNPKMCECIKSMGRCKYARFLSNPKKNTDYADNISDFISEWVTAYDTEPIEK